MSALVKQGFGSLRKLLQYAVGGILILLGVLGIAYLQHRFDQSDINHAVSAVRLARPLGAGDKTLEEKAAAFFKVPVDHISWAPEIESKFMGTVKVRMVPPQGGGNWVYQVDLVRMSVTPLTPEATALSHTK